MFKSKAWFSPGPVALFLISSAALAGPTDSYFVTVPPASSPEVSAKLCTFVHNSITLAKRKPVTTQCALSDAAAEIQKAQNSKQFQYRIGITQNDRQQLVLKIENWKPAGEFDFRIAGPWVVVPTESEEQHLWLQKLIDRFFSQMDGKSRLTQEMALTIASHDSTTITLDPSTGEYLDKKTGKKLDVEAALKSYASESPSKLHFLWTFLDEAAILGAGAVWYVSNKDFNAPDWDLDWDWKSWRLKLQPWKLEAVAFDTNNINCNSLNHPLAGFLYYYMARSNHYNVWQSFLTAFTASALWEYFVEYREKVSLNDVIATPGGGMAIGESIYQLGRFFSRSEPNTLNTVLSSIFGGGEKLHDLLRGVKHTHDGNVDKWGMTTDIWHQFSLWMETAGGTANGSQIAGGATAQLEIGVEADLVNVPEYEKPGKVSRILLDGSFTQIAIQNRWLGKVDKVRFDFLTRAALAGYYKQSIERGERGELKGYSFFIGASTAYDFSTGKIGDQEDTLGVVNVLGPSIELIYHQNGVRVQVRLNVYGDFAMVSALAMTNQEATSRYANDTIKGTLHDGAHYYYAFGITVNPSVVASYRNFEIGGELTYDFFDSIEGADRQQSKLTNDFHIRDQRLRSRAWVAYTLPLDMTKIKFALGIERVERKGEISRDGIRADYAETVGFGRVILLF